MNIFDKAKMIYQATNLQNCLCRVCKAKLELWTLKNKDNLEFDHVQEQMKVWGEQNCCEVCKKRLVKIMEGMIKDANVD